MPATFNEAPREVQENIGQQLNYGSTIIEFMKDLQSDEIIEGLFLGSMADASYIPYRMKHGITHILNVAAEAQPPANPENVEIKCIGWRDSEN